MRAQFMCVTISKFVLTFRFASEYTATVEDLFSRDFGLSGADNTLKVDILDTSGESEFPAMRR